MSGDPSLPSLLHPFARPAAHRDTFVDVVSGSGAEVTDAQGRVYDDAEALDKLEEVADGRIAAVIADEQLDLCVDGTRGAIAAAVGRPG